MNPNTLAIWSGHERIQRIKRERRTWRIFFTCISILIASGFLALIMILASCATKQEIVPQDYDRPLRMDESRRTEEKISVRPLPLPYGAPFSPQRKSK